METTKRTLPENAYRKLEPGETYTPVVAGETSSPSGPRARSPMGLLMAALFSAAAAFLGFKVGQVFEAAIPIAILAVGLGRDLQAALHGAGERDHPVDRRGLGLDRRRLDLHRARACSSSASRSTSSSCSWSRCSAASSGSCS